MDEIGKAIGLGFTLAFVAWVIYVVVTLATGGRW